MVAAAAAACGVMLCAAAVFPDSEAKLAEGLGRVYGSAAPGNLANVRFEKADWPDAQRYAISSSPTGVIVRAADVKGASYAAARILHETGMRRFAPHPAWEVLPENPPRLIALNVDEAPDWRMRGCWSTRQWPETRTNGHHAAWRFMNRMGGDVIRCGHAYEDFVRREREFLEEHPECLALVNGERKGNKLCISNPLLRERFAAHVLERLRADPSAVSASVEPSDGGGWCQCEECAKIGSPTDRAITLANHVAVAVRREFPGKKVALYAYNKHSPPPSVAVDRDVVVVVATQFLLGGWTADALLDAWGAKVGSGTGVREYYYNPSGEPGAGRLANPSLVAETIKDFHSKGARYMCAETTDAWAAGMVALNVAAALLWDSKADPEKVKDDFFRRAFPSAQKEMRMFFSYITAESKRPFCEDLLARMYGALSAAWAKSTPEERKRLAQLAAYARYCEKMLAYRLASTDANAEAWCEAAAALRPYSLVHTGGMFHKRNMVRAFGAKAAKFAEAIDWKKPRPLLAEEWIKEGLANNKRLPFEPVDFGLDLVPAKASAAGQSDLKAVRGNRAFYMWCDGKPFPISVTGGLIRHYRNRGNVKLRLVQIGGVSETGELETEVWSDASVPPDGARRTVEARPKYAGLHRLEVSDGYDMTLYGFPANLPVAIVVTSDVAPPLNGSFLFFVPKGAKTLGFFAKTNRGKIVAPDGKTVFNLAKRNGHFSVDVPPGSGGRFWSVRGLNGTFRPLTAPSVLSINPSVPLVPRGLE